MRKKIALLLMCLSAAIMLLCLVCIFINPEVTLELKAIQSDQGQAWRTSVFRQLPFGVRAVYKCSSRSETGPALLLADDKPFGQLAQEKESVRDVGQGRFWLDGIRLYFSLPDNSDPRTSGQIYTFRSTLQERERVYGIVLLAAMLACFGWALYCYPVPTLWRNIQNGISVFSGNDPKAGQRMGEAIPKGVYAAAFVIVLGLPVLFCVAAFLYLGACVYAFINGYALFAAWPLRQTEQFLNMPGIDSHLAASLRDWAVFCWCVLSCFLFLRRKEMAGRLLACLNGIFIWCGLPALIALFLFHIGCAWAYPEQIFSYGAVLGGQVPFNDAAGHYALPMQYSFDGSFHEWVMRRPFACIMRLGLDVLADWKPLQIVALQTIFLGVSAWILGISLLRHWGVFSAVCGVAFVFLFAKTLLPSFLVEPLGYIWTCLALALLLEALHSPKIRWAFFALAALTIALLVRMGAMFVLPAMTVWILIRFARRWKSFAYLICSCGIIIVCCTLASQTVSNVYLENKVTQGSNFASVFAGLSIGTAWNGPFEKYHEELAGKSEQEQAEVLYHHAFENIQRDPGTFLTSLTQRAWLFCKELKRYLQTGGYGDRTGLLFWPLVLLALWRFSNISTHERGFWLLASAGIVFSAAVVYLDEGPRVLGLGYLLAGLYLTSGLRLSSALRPFRGPNGARLAVWMGLLLLILMITAAPLALRYPPNAVRTLRQYEIPTQLTGSAEFEAVLWGGGTIAGVLVVPDNTDLPDNVPAISLTAFVASIHKSGVEQYQPLVSPSPPEPPFAFVFGVATRSFIFIAPPELLYRTEVPLWKIQYTDWYPGHYWKRITSAVPFDPAEAETTGRLRP